MWNGLRVYAEDPSWILAYRERKRKNPSNYHSGIEDGGTSLLSDLDIINSTLEKPVGPNMVKYSYQLKDFKEDYAIQSNRTIQSSVNCSLIEVEHEQGQYWRWNNWNRTGPFSISMQDPCHNSLIHSPCVNKADFYFS